MNNLPKWTAHCLLWMLNGERVSVKDVLEQHLEDGIDTRRRAELYTNKHIDHDEILLALSAERYPVAIERMAASMRKLP